MNTPPTHNQHSNHQLIHSFQSNNQPIYSYHYANTIQSSISKKQNNFKKQIRRQYIENIFQQKRKLFLNQQQQNQNQIHQLQDLLANIQSKINLNQNLTNLSNLLSNDQIFTNLQQHPDQHQNIISKLTNKIINILLHQIYPSLNSQTLYHQYNRQLVLNCISNIFADARCQNHKYLQIIVSFLEKTYSNVNQNDIKLQLIEIGWIVSNLFRKNVLIHPVKQEAISKLLELFAKLLTIISDIQLMSNMYLALDGFFTNVDKFYHYKGCNSSSRCIQHFKTQRLILLQTTIHQNIKINNGTSLKLSLNFIDHNIEYIQFLEEKIMSALIKSLVTVLNSANAKTLTTAINILIYLCSQKNINEYINSKLIYDYSDNLISIFTYQSITAKILLLQLFNYLCASQQYALVLIRKGLINLLGRFLSMVEDNQFFKYSIILLNKIIINTGRKYVEGVLKTINQLVDRDGQVGDLANNLIDQFNNTNQ